VQESSIPLSPPPICITHTTAILMRDFCAIYDLPPTLPVDAIHHTILVMTISCKGSFPLPCLPLGIPCRAAAVATRRGLTRVNPKPLTLTQHFFFFRVNPYHCPVSRQASRAVLQRLQRAEPEGFPFASTLLGALAAVAPPAHLLGGKRSTTHIYI